MRVPGRAWLEFRVEPREHGGSHLTQRALFAPKGLFGRLYWLAMAPFHPLIFKSMVVKLARDAEQLPPATPGTTSVPAASGDGATSSDAPTAPPAGLVGPGEQQDPGQTPSRRAG